MIECGEIIWKNCHASSRCNRNDVKLSIKNPLADFLERNFFALN